MNKNKQAFTLVELIVVITILAILGTIAFISLQGYSASARDSSRISDIQNIKTSLELFSLNAGKYPLPDNGETKSYSGDLLWIQGTIGDNVTKNLSRNLQSKPLDPLFEIEYTYSVTNTQKEYELFVIYENELLSNILLNNSYAASYIPKVSGTYNQLFVKTPKYIVATPSIISSLPGNLDFKDDLNYIKSQVITGGSNIPNIGTSKIQTTTGGLTDFNLTSTLIITKDSSDAEKISVINMLQNAYSGTTLANNESLYNFLSITIEKDKLVLAELLLGSSGIISSVNNNIFIGNCIFGTSTFGNCNF